MERISWVQLTTIYCVQFVNFLCESQFWRDAATDFVDNASSNILQGLRSYIATLLSLINASYVLLIA